MAMYGEYEEMSVYLPGTTIPDKKKKIVKTEEHLHRGTAVIREAVFSNYNNYCAVVILRKTEDGYDLYKVKNVPQVPVGEQYTNPYECWYYAYCHDGGEQIGLEL